MGTLLIFGSIAAAQESAAEGAAPAQTPSAAESTARFEKLIAELAQQIPAAPEQFDAAHSEEIAKRCRAIDEHAGLALYAPMQSPAEWLPRIQALARGRREVEKSLQGVLKQRFALADQAGSEPGRAALRAFLRIASDLIDLSGRLNFHLRDGVIFASMSVASRQELRQQLVDQVDAEQTAIGAAMLAPLLIDPPADSPNRAIAATPEIKRKVILMLGQRAGQYGLEMMMRFLALPDAPADLRVLAADSVIRMGLPQARLPEGEVEPDRSPEPVATAAGLLETLKTMKVTGISKPMQSHRETLTGWLSQRAKAGVLPAGYWNGQCTLQPGDWVLLRNSSPYNLFTDLSPGLFTHVGIVTLHTGRDGIQRLVVVDLNERQTVIRPVNVEATIPRSLYYAVLRHEDPAVAKKMGDVAASMIGSPMKFDLNFETARAQALKGKLTKGTKIETYCAGLLLLCAQETGEPEESFFPVREQPALGRTAENMKRIGLQLGADFISPTGPLFARRMKLVHFSEPLYNPGREIEQRIYDHFANGLANSTIEPKSTLFQSLRLDLAEASKGNPFLARAIAEAAGVDQETDLASAARAAAVIETLDSIAYGASGDFQDTLRAFRAGPLDDRAKDRFTDEQIERFKTLRKTHEELYQKLERRQASPQSVTEALVGYYIASGVQQIDKHFFPSSKAPEPAEN